jgi:hypothetical protein
VPRRIRTAAVVAIGLALGVGGAVVFRQSGTSPAVRAEQPASVTRFSFTDGVLAPVAGEASAPFGSTPAEEPATAEAALSYFLQSLVDGRPDDAYAVLDPSSRRRFPSPGSWRRAQADLTPPTEFEVGLSRPAFGGGERAEIEVTSSQNPSLDATRGLVPARSRSLWTVERTAEGWRVGADPVSVVPILPPDGGGTTTVTAWVDRLRACDPPGAASLQVGAYLYGPAAYVRAPCERQGSWTVGDPTGLASAGDPRDLVAAFGPAVDSWARLVPVEGPGTRFYAVVAPMGDAWQVVGVADRG